MSSHFNSGIQCLSLIAHFHQIPAEPSALLREFQHNDLHPDDKSLADINLIRAAKSLGFKAKFIVGKVEKLSEHTLPAIVRHQNVHFFIIAKISKDEVLIHDLTNCKSNNKPTMHSFDELTSFGTGDLLLLIACQQ